MSHVLLLAATPDEFSHLTFWITARHQTEVLNGRTGRDTRYFRILVLISESVKTVSKKDPDAVRRNTRRQITAVVVERLRSTLHTWAALHLFFPVSVWLQTQS